MKVNVIFFDAVRQRADGAPATDQVSIYDFRSSLHFAATQSPLLRIISMTSWSATGTEGQGQSGALQIDSRR